MKRRLLVLAPEALEAFALQWFMHGFAESAADYNGTKISSPAVRRIMRLRFGVVWARSGAAAHKKGKKR